MSEITSAERRLFRAAALEAVKETLAEEVDGTAALQSLESQIEAVLQGPPLDGVDPVEDIRVRATLAADLNEALDAVRTPAVRR